MTELRLSDLSTERQAFIRRCQRLGHGTIRGLEVRDGEPSFGRKTEVLRDLKLDGDEPPRPEQNLNNFVLCKEIQQLFSALDSIRNGAIDQVVIRAGVPRRMVFRATDPADDRLGTPEAGAARAGMLSQALAQRFNLWAALRDDLLYRTPRTYSHSKTVGIAGRIPRFGFNLANSIQSRKRKTADNRCEFGAEALVPSDGGLITRIQDRRDIRRRPTGGQVRL